MLKVKQLKQVCVISLAKGNVDVAKLTTPGKKSLIKELSKTNKLLQYQEICGNNQQKYLKLRQEVKIVLQNGDFPIIIGNDPKKNQTKHCYSALKKVHPGSKILKVGGLETNSQRKSKLITGLKPKELKNDICFFGTQKAKDIELVQSNYILQFEQEECHEDNIDSIGKQVERYFNQDKNKYWISMAMDSIDKCEWNNPDSTESDESKFSPEFIESFIDRFVPESLGMNIMDTDKQLEESSYKNIIEMAIHNVNLHAMYHKYRQLAYMQINQNNTEPN